MSQTTLKWIVGEDTGLSSKALWARMMGVEDGPKSHPLDSSDLGRCLRLLERVPEWKPRISEMADVSPYWEALVENWDELRGSMLDEAGPDFDWKSGTRSGKTYSLMKSILRPTEDADSKVIRMGAGMSMRFGADR